MHPIPAVSAPPATPNRRAARLVALAVLLLATLTAAAQASGSPITLQTAYGGPIATSNRVCTAEPRALIYGTTNYNAGSPLSYVSDGLPGPGYYVPANGPSALDLLASLQSGARRDLCLGFTLPPDAEAAMIRTFALPGDRLQDTPAWDDLPETHVVPDAPGDPAPAGDDLRTLAIDLPPGQGLNLAAQATCSATQFGEGSLLPASCPAASQIGDALLRLGLWDGLLARHLPLTGVKVYLLAGAQGALPRVGIIAEPLAGIAPLKLVLQVAVTPAGRLRLVGDELPRDLYDAADVGPDGAPVDGAVARPTYLESLGLRLWGNTADHPTLLADLAATTTACTAPALATVTATTYAGAASSLTPTALAANGCSSLDFDPGATLTLDDPSLGAPTGATLRLALGGLPAGRAPARATSISAALPAGLRLGSQLAADGLALCAADAFAATSSAPADCPAASRIGTAAAQTDLVGEPLAGDLFVGAPGADGDLAAVLVQLALGSGADAPRLKLTGGLALDDAGEVTLRLDALPVLPLTSLTLALRGGDQAILTAPAACGGEAGTVRIGGSEGSTAELSLPAPTPASCEPAAPSVQASLTAPAGRAGGRDGLSLTVATPSRAPALRNVTATLPQGALVDVRGTARCAAAAIDEGTCAADATLGTVQLELGAGAALTTVTGTLIRGEDDAGALASARARIRVQLGALTLGTVDVPVAIGYDAAAGRAIVAVSAPTSVAGRALDLRGVSIAFAAGVGQAPTGCGRSLDLAATVAGGANVTATSPLALSGCDALPFAPTLRATLAGESAVGGHPRAVVAITPRAGDGAIRAMEIGLPTGLELDGAQPTCAAAAFASGSCGDAGRIGSVTAAGTMLAAPVGGTLRLVATGGRLPGIGVEIGGSYGVRALGSVAAGSGRHLLTLPELPDLPLTQLELAFDGGRGGALKITGAVCAAGAAWRFALTGHGGQRAQSTQPLQCQATPTAAAPRIELSVKAKTGLKLKLSGFGARRLQAAKLTLAPRLSFVPAAARQRRNTAIAVIGPSTKAAFSSSSLTLTLATAGSAPQEVVARVRWPAMTVAPRGPRKVTFRLRLAFTDGTVLTKTVPVTLPAALPQPTAKTPASAATGPAKAAR